MVDDWVVGLLICFVLLVGWFIVDKIGVGEWGVCGIVVLFGLNNKVECIVVIYLWDMLVSMVE